MQAFLFSSLCLLITIGCGEATSFDKAKIEMVQQPHQGWLVSGKVLEVDEGNRLRGAMIGFGQGVSDAQLYVAVSDLTHNNSPPFTEMKVDSSTGHAPGAVVTMNPYVAAAKMVLARNPSEKDIQRAGIAIADRLKEAVDKAP